MPINILLRRKNNQRGKKYGFTYRGQDKFGFLKSYSRNLFLTKNEMEMEFEKFLHLLFFCEILLLQNKRNVAHQIKNTNNNQIVTLNQKKMWFVTFGHTNVSHWGSLRWHLHFENWFFLSFQNSKMASRPLFLLCRAPASSLTAALPNNTRSNAAPCAPLCITLESRMYPCTRLSR